MPPRRPNFKYPGWVPRRVSLGLLIAYPALLAAAYGVSRLARSRLGPWEWARLALLLALLATVTTLQLGWAAAGLLGSGWTIAGATLGIMGIAGLAGVQVLAMWRGGDRARQ